MESRASIVPAWEETKRNLLTEDRKPESDSLYPAFVLTTAFVDT